MRMDHELGFQMEEVEPLTAKATQPSFEGRLVLCRPSKPRAFSTPMNLSKSWEKRCFVASSCVRHSNQGRLLSVDLAELSSLDFVGNANGCNTPVCLADKEDLRGPLNFPCSLAMKADRCPPLFACS